MSAPREATESVQRCKDDHRHAVQVLERAYDFHEVACRMDHHARYAIYEARQMRGALDSQLVQLSRANGQSMEPVLAELDGWLPVPDDVSARLTEVLQWAIAATRADMGNVQLYNPHTGALQIQAQLGFDQRFLSYFNEVHAGQAARGSALNTGAQVVVEDVTDSPIFRGTGSLEVMLDARARAVQSTPLVLGWCAVDALSPFATPVRT